MTLLKAKGKSNPAFECGASNANCFVIGQSCHSWPYRLRTSRQPLPTRKLWIASVAPHRRRLLQFMPPERSQNQAAADRQGAKSRRSTACAIVAERPRKRNEATTIFVTGPILHSGCEAFSDLWEALSDAFGSLKMAGRK